MKDKPKYNPQIHHRRSIRFKHYDYSRAGAYFITICCQDMECRFGYVDANSEMVLNEYGILAYNEWAKLTDRFSNFELDVFQIMPNHMHGIILLNDVDAQSQNTEQPNTGQPQGIAPTGTVGDIVGAYKSLVVHEILEWLKLQPVEIGLGKLWQRNYWEHVIRNEKSYQKISDYIINNPGNWKDDKFYKP